MTAPVLPRTWRDAAACVGRPDLFAAAIDEDPAAIAEAKDVCTACEIRLECLAWAQRVGEPHGVWGGLDPDERAALARRTGSVRPTVRGTTGWWTTGHGTRPVYNSGCRCGDCRAANTRFMQKRRDRCHSHSTLVLVTLTVPSGRGRGRAWPGQVAWVIA